FKTNTFAHTLREASCLDTDIVTVLHTLVPKAKERRARVRLIGVALTSLTYNQHQLRLFGGKLSEKWERVLEGVDHIRDKHGFESIRTAKSMTLGKNVKLATPSLSR
ncbi:MAG: hypothetical protein WC655_04350, partial [Candidatus Hydrogenedentales bacterium]